MDIRWKVDLGNLGACRSLGKELAASYPNFKLFLSQNLLSDVDGVTSEGIYNFFISLVSSQQQELYILETELENSKATILEYQQKLDQLLQENLQKSRGHISQQAKSFSAYKPRQNEIIITIENLKTFRLAATRIQKYWRGYKARIYFKQKISQVITKVRPTGPRSLPNKQVMEIFAKEVEKKKLTMEQFYRAADKDCDGKVSFEEIKNFIDDLKIVISRSTLTRFMQIVDEDCSGIIDKAEFLNALSAYNLSKEPSNSDRTYEEEMLLKLVKIMDSRGIDPENLFSMCDTDSSGSMNLKELESYLIKLKVGFQVKEVHALMRRLDTDNNGELSLPEFKNHFSKGQNFFKQEIVSSTHSALPTQLNKNVENSSIRDIFKTLEYTGNFMHFLVNLKSLPEGQTSVSNFFVSIEKMFNCKLIKTQLEMFRKVIVLNDKGMVSFETFKPIVVFYTTKSLESRENYATRVKMHLPPNKPEEKIFTRKEMVEELFFSPEQCMEAIQFLAEPGEEYFSSDFFYTEKEEVHGSIEKVDSFKVVQYFIEKIKESGLDIRNIFRFADKKNENEIPVQVFCTACEKLLKNVNNSYMEDLKTLIAKDYITLEDLIVYFPLFKLDRNGLTVEAVHWLRYLGKTFRDARMTSIEFFKSLPPDAQGKSSYLKIKTKIKEKFESIILLTRVRLISENVFPDDSTQIDSDGFIRLLLVSQDSDHSITDLKEYEKKIQVIIEEERKVLRPPATPPKPIIVPGPHLSEKTKIVIKSSNPLENEDLTNSLKKISQKIVPEGSWSFELLRTYNIPLELIFANENSLFSFTQQFEITKNENHDIYVEIVKKNSNCPLIYAYQLGFFIDMVTHSLHNLPAKWNKAMAASTGSAFQKYLRQKKIENVDLLSVFKNITKKIDLIVFDEFGTEGEKISSFFHMNSPMYHFLAVLDSYLDDKVHSVFNIIKSRMNFHRDFFNQDRPIDEYYLNKTEMQEKLLNKVFIDIEVKNLLSFLYPKMQENLPFYSFQYLVDIIKENWRKPEISFDPYNTPETDSGSKLYFSKLSEVIKFPVFHYFGNSDLKKTVSLTTLKSIVTEVHSKIDLNRLDIIAPMMNIPIYHFCAVLDSYRSEPVNLFFNLGKIFKIFGSGPRRENFKTHLSNLSKEKALTQEQLIKKLDEAFEEKLSDSEKNDLIFFIDPFSNRKEFHGFQLSCVFNLCEKIEFLTSFPYMLNHKLSKEGSDLFYGISNLLNTNSLPTLKISNISLDKILAVEDLTGIKMLETFKSYWPGLKKLIGEVPYYYFLAAIESYRPHNYKSEIESDFSSFPDSFLRLIDRSKKLITIFKNLPLNNLFIFEDFSTLLKGCFQGISDEIIERLFKKMDKRSFETIFMYEVLTAIDLMQKNSLKKIEIRFMYQDEFQAMPENSGIVRQEYTQKKEAHKLYIQLAQIFDEYKIPTLRKMSLWKTNINDPLTGFEKISLDDLKSYLMRVTSKQFDVSPIYENLKINGEVTFYHFFAVFESYRKKVIVDKYEDNLNKTGNLQINKISNIAQMDRNPNDIIIPSSTAGIELGSYNDCLYQLKKIVKDAYNSIYNLFRSKSVNSQILEYDQFKAFIKEVYPRISEVNLNELIRSVDRDKDKKIDYEEFFNYIFNQPIDQSPRKISPKSDEDRKLERKDYFDPCNRGITTILNSEEAAIIRCKELISKLVKNSDFRDPDFGPTVGVNGNTCLYWSGKPPSSSYPDPKSQELVWKSCKEAYSGAKFIKGGTGSGDVIQGSLGDCWFIGALSVMALRDDLLYGNIENLNSPEEITIENGKNIRKGVYSALFHGLGKLGMFVFKFFINSAWRWTIVDDLIPMFADPENNIFHYVFGHCKESDELWVPLLEKAYAKVFGCYEALNGGLIDDGLTDLTGLVAEKCKITGKGGFLETNPNEPTRSDELWQRLVRYREDKTLMGCSIEGDGVEGDVVIDGERTGLLSRHAYAIIDILTIDDPAARKQRHRLIRIRNPWGQREWQGRWCDGSEELEKFSKRIEEITSKLGDEEKFGKFDPNDGTFFMNFKSWRNIFHNLYACVDFSEKWSGVRFAGEWNKENSGGVPLTGTPAECVKWAKNPQYCINLMRDSELFINLSQEDGRYVPNSKFPFEETIKTACFTILRGSAEDIQVQRFDQSKIVKLSVLKAHRNVEMRIPLKAGKYFLVPATMNEGECGKFWLSTYFDCAKRDVTVYNCKNESEKGGLIYEEEEDDANLTEEDLNKLRKTFASLNAA